MQQAIYRTRIAVRWGDMDAYGHVNNAMYLRYMEEARVQLLYQMGIELDGTGQGPVIITASSTFLLPVTYPDTLTVDCFALQPGRSSFMTYYHLYSEALNKQRVCEGEAKVVWIDTRTNASVPLPGAIREMVESSQLN